ncbi:hypothetical protein MMC10_001029 [Thelotrema lepadinum]|nr:hypothetical protein [Thelotrema lepadinum]
MAMEGDSIDISQLRMAALSSPPNLNGFGAPSLPRDEVSPASFLEERLPTELLETPLPVENALHPPSPAKKAKMTSCESQKSVSTQEFSQWIVEASKSDGTGKQNTDFQLGTTYTPGQTGHVDLESCFQEHVSQLATQNGEVGITPRRDAVHTKLFPEEKRFTNPATPALNGEFENKRNDATPLFATPKLPKNPFGGAFEVDGMGLSQVFKITQAPSSPTTIAQRIPIVSSDRPSPKVPVTNTNDLPSDITLDSISPVVNGTHRPFTAPSSSPAIGGRYGTLQRAVTEPQTVYISRKESQEKRERKRREQLDASSSPIDKDGAIVDALLEDTSEIQREHKRRKVARDTKAILNSITAPPRPTAQLDRKVKTTTPVRKVSPFPKLLAKKHDEVVLSSDDTDENGTEDETEPEEDIEASPIQSDDDMADENKENRGEGNVQVPMTGLQVKRGAYVYPSSFLSSSPSARRRQTKTPEKDDSEDELTRSPGTHTLGPSRRLQAVYKEQEPITIADSQSSQRKSNVHRRYAQKGQLGSSNNDGKIVPQSQTVKIPVSSEKSSSVVRRNIRNSSQQTLSPPSSSLLKGSNPSKVALAGKCVDAGVSTTNQTLSPNSSPPQALRSSRLPNGSIERAQDAEVTSVNNSSKASCPKVHVDGKQQPSAALNRSSDVHSSSLPQLEADVELALTSQKADLPSTIPETTSHPSYERRPMEEAVSASLPVKIRSSRRCITPEKGDYHISQQLSASPGSAHHTHNSVTPMPGLNRPLMPKSLTAIVAEVQDNEGPDVGDLDLGLFTADDADFRERMEQWDGSSPIGPARKRRRGLGGRPIVAPEPSSISKPDLSSDQDINPPLIHPVATLELEDELATGPTTSPVGTKRLSGRKILQIGEHMPSPVQIQSAPKQSPSNFKIKKALRGVHQTRPSSTTSTGAIHSPLSGRKSSISKLHNLPASINPNIGLVESRDSTDRNLRVQTTSAPRRVLAIFNGSPQGFFAATCLAPTPDGKYKVRFDDGTITLVSVSAIKRLELREGDEVKVYRAGQRAQIYTVVGFETGAIGDRPDGDPQYPPTDIFGHLSVKIRPVKKSGPSTPNEEEIVPISDVYLTTQLWRKLQDRFYTHPPDDTLRSGFHTPSERSSTPSTPQSRMRFAKAASNLSTNQRAIAASKVTSYQISDLFADVIFVMTCMAEEHRGQVQRSISDNGGVLLSHGWDEVFDTPSPESLPSTSKTVNSTLPPSSATNSTTATDPFNPNSAASTARFALLLADTHCRTLKYLHALALGIPCIHTRWVADCIRAGNLVDWRPYVLASGQSSFLGDAICGRTLSFDSHSGSAVALREMICTRNKWLDSNKVLLVSGAKASAEITRAYVFIMYALGAKKVGVVNSRKEAEEVLRKKAADNGWDWVCVIEDEKVDSSVAGTKKRKRGHAKETMGVVASSDVEALEKCTNARVVGTEIIVQSLILGRFLEE